MFDDNKVYFITGRKLNRLLRLCEAIHKGKYKYPLDIAKEIGEGVGLYWKDEWITSD